MLARNLLHPMLTFSKEEAAGREQLRRQRDKGMGIKNIRWEVIIG